jgi:hypothetical protein
MTLLVTVASWSFGQSAGDLEPIESGVTLRLEAPIELSGTRKFILEVQTNDVYECANYSLDNSAKLEGSKLLIGLKGVRRTEPCTATMAPATCRIDLTELKAGAYKVRFNINRQIFKAKLTVADSSYDFRIASEDPRLFRIYNGHLNLIPANCIWGLSEYTDPKKKAEALKFMAALESAGAKKTSLPVGNYDEFYLHTAGTTEQKMIQGERYQYPFVYFYSGDTAVLQEVINSFRDKLKITLKTTRGEVLANF